MAEAPAIAVNIVPRLAALDPAQWDRCAAGARPCEPANPFLRHAFLDALEEAGCVGGRTGWMPQHLVVNDTSGEIAAAMPCYVKTHSQGEYIFDHAWADAFERAGGRYYPKLLVAVPFTPVTGPRLMVRDGVDRDRHRRILLQGAIALLERHGASSLHINFATEEEYDFLGLEGFLRRTDQQFHWLNAGYRSFDDFVAALSSRKRKQIRRERRAALGSDIVIHRLTGSAITQAHWDAFFAFYMDTGGRKWGRPYLNRKFFSLIGERMANDILLVMAERHGRFIAGALNLIGPQALYGRNWGCIEDHPFLHFEVCYYQAIDFAIERGLARVEAGAQGAHKLARGYLPVATRSAHFIANASFRHAVEHYLERERAHAELELRFAASHAPYRKTADDFDQVHDF
jgi:uncharacterized protein